MGRRHASKCSQMGGGQAVAGKLPSAALALTAKSLEKKALVFSDPGKGRVFQLGRQTQEYRINVEKPILKVCIM